MLGHENCGAVKAALDQVNKGTTVPGEIQSVVDPILPAIGEAIGATAGALVATALVAYVIAGHRSGRLKLLARAGEWSERQTGLPAWASLPSMLLGVSLLTFIILFGPRAAVDVLADPYGRALRGSVLPAGRCPLRRLPYDRADLDADALRAFDRPVYFALGGRSNPDYFARMAGRLDRIFPDFEVETFAERHHFDPPHRIEPERLANSLLALWERAEVLGGREAPIS